MAEEAAQARIEELENQIQTLLRANTHQNSLSITAAAKLFEKGFSGEPKELNDFIDNVESAYALVDEELHPTLLKYVLSKIVGDAKRTLNIRDSANLTWQYVREKLETHYSVQRTFEFYTTQLCNIKQRPNENVTQWGTRMEQLISNVITSMNKFTKDWSEAEASGGRKTMARLGRNLFVNGITNDVVREAVKLHVGNLSMKETIDRAAQEECDRKYNVGFNKSQYPRPTRPFTNQVVVKKEHVNAVSNVKCFNCLKFGHIARDCKAMQSKKGVKHAPPTKSNDFKKSGNWN